MKKLIGFVVFVLFMMLNSMVVLADDVEHIDTEKSVVEVNETLDTLGITVDDNGTVIIDKIDLNTKYYLLVKFGFIEDDLDYDIFVACSNCGKTSSLSDLLKINEYGQWVWNCIAEETSIN